MELLKSLYSINSKSGKEAEIKAFVLDYIARIEDVVVEEDDFGNLFIRKGGVEPSPCVVAHLDEVHDVECRVVVEDGDMLYATDATGERLGLGADDKNGIWIALRLLEQKSALRVALFVHEEKLGELAGCRGSRACDLSRFDDATCLLQCDRRGNSDLVTIGKGDIMLCREGFFPADLLARYGYCAVPGGRTDVVALRERGLEKDCCNISCGYYNAHKSDEYTIFSHLQNALAFVSELIDSLSA